MSLEKKETKEFQAQTKQLLDLMVNSIYTNQEIFLRELISNSSDAIDKLKFKSLTKPDILDEDKDFEIIIETNKEDNTITISDNGIGMTYQEVIDNIGTIAQSGTQKFLEKLKNNKDNIDLIGQFGVGFYSSFMVAEKVTLVTKAAEAETGVKWESSGDGSYSIKTIDKKKRGTSIKLKLREEFSADGDEEDFTNPHLVKGIVKKYSDYVQYPIKMEMPTEDDETKVETLNNMTPLWKQDKAEIDEKDYAEFYKNNFQDWQEPFETIHWSVEGLVKFTALLFIPQKLPQNLFSPDFETGLKLYSKDNFILDKCEEILPDYLKFVKGLIDSPDFSLNISREMLQNNRQLRKIGKNAEKVILRRLRKMLNKQRDRYEDFWQEFGPAIKGGIQSNPTKKDKLTKLLLFASSKAEMTTLDEYIERMNEEQDSIYYVVGENKASIKRLPQMELLQDKDLEVLYLFDEIDEFVINSLQEYNDVKFKSVLSGELDLDEDDQKDLEDDDEVKALLATIKENLANKVDDVRISKRLKSSAACLVSGDDGMSMAMEKVFKQMDQNMAMQAQAERILELNPNHQLFSTMKKLCQQDPKSERLKEYSQLLYSLSSLIEGFEPEDPVELSEKITKLMAEVN